MSDKKYVVELSAREVLALYDMCEHVGSVIYRATPVSATPPKSFVIVSGIQGKLESCTDMEGDTSSLVYKAQKEVGGSKLWEDLPELDPKKNPALAWLQPTVNPS